MHVIFFILLLIVIVFFLGISFISSILNWLIRKVLGNKNHTEDQFYQNNRSEEAQKPISKIINKEDAEDTEYEEVK